MPIPTLGPLLEEYETRLPFAAPAAPTILGWPATRLVNEQQLTSLWETDVLLRWTHPSPPGSNWHQVWTAVDEPYFEPGACAACRLEGITSAQRFVSDAEGLSFIPDYWTGGGADLMSRIQTYRVVTCNRAGCSAPSNEMGAVVYSVNQGIPELPH